MLHIEFYLLLPRPVPRSLRRVSRRGTLDGMYDSGNILHTYFYIPFPRSIRRVSERCTLGVIDASSRPIVSHIALHSAIYTHTLKWPRSFRRVSERGTLEGIDASSGPIVAQSVRSKDVAGFASNSPCSCVCHMCVWMGVCVLVWLCVFWRMLLGLLVIALAIVSIVCVCVSVSVLVCVCVCVCVRERERARERERERVEGWCWICEWQPL